MKTIFLPKGYHEDSKRKAVIQWLIENISEQGVRWWFEDEVQGRVMIELTEEEESLMSLYMLRWTSVE